MNSIIAFFTGGWQGTLAAAAIGALLAAGGTYYVTSLSYRVAIAQMQRDQANSAVTAANGALKQFTADAGTIHDAAAAFGFIRDDLTIKLASISKDFHVATKAAPLPVDCKPDAVRLRSLASAIAATNSAVGLQLSAAVPGRP